MKVYYTRAHAKSNILNFFFNMNFTNNMSEVT